MGNKIDLTGKRFGRLVAVRESGRSKCGAVMWECQCDCGNKTIIKGSDLRAGTVVSCRCYSRDLFIKNITTHGFWHHPIFNVWRNMIARCYIPEHDGYEHYGGRGISVCREWQGSPKEFIAWAEKNGWKKGLQIDRFNNEGNYSPSNCRFATPSENALNTRLLQVRNTSGFRGVSWHKRLGKYRAMVHLENKSRWLGAFPTAIEAAKARDAFVIEKGLHTPLNFPELKVERRRNTNPLNYATL